MRNFDLEAAVRPLVPLQGRRPRKRGRASSRRRMATCASAPGGWP